MNLARARCDLLHGGTDQTANFLGRFAAALREAAHLAGHHGKATALLTGPRRFYSGIQRQDIGLEGNAINRANDFTDALGLHADGVHGRHHFGHITAALLRHTRGFQRQLVGTRGRFRIQLNRIGQIGHGG